MNRPTSRIQLAAAGVAVALLVLALPSAAQLYKYIDKATGKTVYSDQPPPDQDGKTIKVQTGGAETAPAKTAVSRDKELDKDRKKSADESKKADDAAKNAAKTEEACARAKENLARYAEGGRITKLNAQGERVYMEDSEIAANREKTRRDMEELCKKS